MDQKRYRKLNKQLQSAQAELVSKLEEKKAKKVKKSYNKPIKEKYKEIKESLKPKIVSEQDGENYEEFLIKSLFTDKELKEKERSLEVSTDQETTEKPKRQKSGTWDYTLDDEIKFFDPECSYELTKYRPINETKGLNFDPAPFTEMARLYDQTGKYTQYPEGSKPYADFWNEQIRRCKEGYEVNGYRITGDNYFFLNFYRMQTVIEGNTAGRGRNESFPSFLAKQYEFFHYVEMAEKLHKDVGILKARGL